MRHRGFGCVAVAGVAVLACWADAIYVNGTSGDDAWDGLCEVWDGGTCGPKETIQAGMDVALPGESVIVAPGTYIGQGNRDLDFTPDVTVRGTDPNDPAVVAATIIDCEAMGSGFVFTQSEHRDSLLAGLTIRNANGDGIYCDAWTRATISACTIESSTGAGIYGHWYASPLIQGCSIRGNAGGGVRFAYETLAVVRNCRITENFAPDGAGLYCYSGWPAIANCNISQNEASGNGGGVWWSDSGLDLINCTVSGNLAVQGGGVYGWNHNYLDSPVLVNCVLWANAAEIGPSIALGGDFPGPDVLSVAYSAVEGGLDGVFVPPAWTLVWGPGNIDVDPLFADPSAGNFRILAGSPCVDAGNNTAVPPGLTHDLAGRPRIVDGDDDGTATVDLGAYEFSTSGDLDCDGLVDFHDINPFVLALSDAADYTRQYPDCDILNADTNGDESVNLRDINPFVVLLHHP